MLQEKFKHHQIVLGSASPRRRELFSSLNLPFAVETTDAEEAHDEKIFAHQRPTQVARQLAAIKAQSYNLPQGTLLITADTIVSLKKEILGKPTDSIEATQMLNKLSGKRHKVITAICIKEGERQQLFHCKTTVKFAKLTPQEIAYYIDNFAPTDKAGAYGIQEWIGQIGIQKIKGSYYNVMGLPTHQLYKALKKW